MQLGNLNLLILKSISKSEKYGLEIIDDISKDTNGAVVIKQPSLYSGLRRLEQRGLISSRWEDSEIGGRRHYYTITNLGKTELASHTEQEFVPEAKTEENTTAPQEVFTENVFAENVEAKQDEAVSASDEQPATPSMKQPTYFEQIDNKEQATNYAEYDPTSDTEDKPKTFSDTMRDYVEPQNEYNEYKFDEQPTQKTEQEEPKEENANAEADIIDSAQKIANGYEAPQDTVVEYVHSNKEADDEINYKDILGDLDANLNDVEGEPQQAMQNEAILNAEDNAEAATQDRQKSAYEKELEQILLSSEKDDATHQLTIKETDRMEEVNHRYGEGPMSSVHPDEVVEDETFDENIHKIAPKDVGFTYLNQDNITVKPYKKANKKANKTGLFLNVNKFNLVRASIMFVLMALELTLLYLIGNANGLFEGLGATTTILFSISAAVVVLYFAISLIYTLPNISKKKSIQEIEFGKDILYRFIMFAFIILFIIGLNLFMGMPNTISWLIPAIMTTNILISWIVGIIMYNTKAFHA
ncbi:MAG: helix-turn-helix transcriptional regulator [Clostridia bacterium]|nr:helix-turn-helix transcriptional regulator [Clostridia bacterium]